MLLSNQIPGFFDHQYLKKHCIMFFDIFHGDIPQGKLECETTTFSWVWSGMLSHDQTYIDLQGVNLVGPGDVRPPWKINWIQREKNSHHEIHKILNDWIKCVLVQPVYRILWSTSLEGNNQCLRSKSNTVGWVWPGLPSYAQTFLSFSGDVFVWSGSCITTKRWFRMKNNDNSEWKINEVIGKQNCFFIIALNIISGYCLKDLRV